MILILPIGGWTLLALLVLWFVCSCLNELGNPPPPGPTDAQRDAWAAERAAERAAWKPAFEGDTFEWWRARRDS